MKIVQLAAVLCVTAVTADKPGKPRLHGVDSKHQSYGVKPRPYVGNVRFSRLGEMVRNIKNFLFKKIYLPPLYRHYKPHKPHKPPLYHPTLKPHKGEHINIDSFF